MQRRQCFSQWCSGAAAQGREVFLAKALKVLTDATDLHRCGEIFETFCDNPCNL